MAAEAGQGLMSAVGSYARGDMGGVFKSAMGLVKTATAAVKKQKSMHVPPEPALLTWYVSSSSVVLLCAQQHTDLVEWLQGLPD